MHDSRIQLPVIAHDDHRCNSVSHYYIDNQKAEMLHEMLKNMAYAYHLQKR